MLKSAPQGWRRMRSVGVRMQADAKGEGIFVALYELRGNYVQYIADGCVTWCKWCGAGPLRSIQCREVDDLVSKLMRGEDD